MNWELFWINQTDFFLDTNLFSVVIVSYKINLPNNLEFPYLQVYRGTLPTGELVAIKRAQQGSMQGGLEFKTELELLSRVHHKNVVSLLGFCFEQGEQMLIYEYIPNGSLSDSLSGIFLYFPTLFIQIGLHYQ